MKELKFQNIILFVIFLLSDILLIEIAGIFENVNNTALFYLYIIIFSAALLQFFTVLFIFRKKYDENYDKSEKTQIQILKANAKYRKEFLGNVSHELKTPIFNIQGYIHTLIDGGLHDEDINMKYLKQSAKNIKRLISIVNDLDAISKLESEVHKLKYENFDFIELCNEVIELSEDAAKERNIELKIIAEPKKIEIFADKEKITELLSNLVSNSIKYGNEYGKTEIRVTEFKDKYKISVADNGIGIKEKYQDRIFERFFRVDKSRSLKYGGTGLGLAIVKHILEAHGEHITVKSMPGMGSIFSFYLKKAKKNEE